MGKKITPNKRIASKDIILGDSSVVSRQWVQLPAGGELPTPEQMLERYFVFLRLCTLSLVRPVATAGGIAFRLAGLHRPLLLFAPPESSRNGASRSVALRIQGGLLVQGRECGRGMLTFTVSPLPDGVELSVQVADYCPLLLGGPGPSRLRSWLYRSTQAIVHRLITVRFLNHLCRSLDRGE
ncbi:MAG: hypothetical protein EG824_10635 [Deltaproteobacteria bacterium]|nr:hypothetical protein [Deltaproteobacteria bacterium]